MGRPPGVPWIEHHRRGAGTGSPRRRPVSRAPGGPGRPPSAARRPVVGQRPRRPGGARDRCRRGGQDDAGGPVARAASRRAGPGGRVGVAHPAGRRGPRAVVGRPGRAGAVRRVARRLARARPRGAAPQRGSALPGAAGRRDRGRGDAGVPGARRPARAAGPGRAGRRRRAAAHPAQEVRAGAVRPLHPAPGGRAPPGRGAPGAGHGARPRLHPRRGRGPAAPPRPGGRGRGPHGVAPAYRGVGGRTRARRVVDGAAGGRAPLHRGVRRGRPHDGRLPGRGGPPPARAGRGRLPAGRLDLRGRRPRPRRGRHRATGCRAAAGRGRARQRPGDAGRRPRRDLPLPRDAPGVPPGRARAA